MNKKFFRDVASGALALVAASAICTGASSVRHLYAGQAQMNERLSRIETKLGIDQTKTQIAQNP